MKVTEAELIISAVSREQYPNHQLPEIALSGRSNVGKSSFINQMIGRKKLARISQVPGKTQTLNFYLINNKFFFVDVPGYGYAKVSKREREAWGRMIEAYFMERTELQGAILLVDSRHPPTKDDQSMYQWFTYYQIPVLVVATKVDKIPKNKRSRQLKQVAETLDLHETDSLYSFSAVTGEGKQAIWDTLERWL